MYTISGVFPSSTAICLYSHLANQFTFSQVSLSEQSKTHFFSFLISEFNSHSPLGHCLDGFSPHETSPKDKQV